MDSYQKGGVRCLGRPSVKAPSTPYHQCLKSSNWHLPHQCFCNVFTISEQYVIFIELHFYFTIQIWVMALIETFLIYVIWYVSTLSHYKQKQTNKPTWDLDIWHIRIKAVFILCSLLGASRKAIRCSCKWL